MVVVREGDCDGRVCVDENVLTVKYLHPGDSGRYTCVAKNKYGQDQRQVVLRVEVRYSRTRGGILYNPLFLLLLFLFASAVDLRPSLCALRSLARSDRQLYKGSKRVMLPPLPPQPGTRRAAAILHLPLGFARSSGRLRGAFWFKGCILGRKIDIPTPSRCSFVFPPS